MNREMWTGLGALALMAASSTASAQTLTVRPETNGFQIESTGFPAVSADGMTVVALSTAYRASGAPNLTVHVFDVAHQRLQPAEVVLSVEDAERAMAGAAHLSSLRATVEARVAAMQARFVALRLRALTGGGEAAPNPERTEGSRAIDAMIARSANGRVTLANRGNPTGYFVTVPIPPPGTPARCRTANGAYLGAAWVEQNLFIARLDYTGTNLCQAPAPRWIFREFHID